RSDGFRRAVINRRTDAVEHTVGQRYLDAKPAELLMREHGSNRRRRGRVARIERATAKVDCLRLKPDDRAAGCGRLFGIDGRLPDEIDALESHVLAFDQKSLGRDADKRSAA